MKDLERGEQAEILGSEEEIHSKEIEGFPSQEEVDEKGSTKHGVKELAAAESVLGEELKDEWKASPTLEPEASLESEATLFLLQLLHHHQTGSWFSIKRRTSSKLACTREPSSITRRGRWLA